MDANKFREEYKGLRHAIQIGTVFEINHDPQIGEPKLLWIELNYIKSDIKAILSILVKKGMITEERSFDFIIEELREEVKRMEERLASIIGSKIKLY